jgi:hypothetical protein
MLSLSGLNLHCYYPCHIPQPMIYLIKSVSNRSCIFRCWTEPRFPWCEPKRRGSLGLAPTRHLLERMGTTFLQKYLNRSQQLIANKIIQVPLLSFEWNDNSLCSWKCLRLTGLLCKTFIWFLKKFVYTYLYTFSGLIDLPYPIKNILFFDPGSFRKSSESGFPSFATLARTGWGRSWTSWTGSTTLPSKTRNRSTWGFRFKSGGSF